MREKKGEKYYLSSRNHNSSFLIPHSSFVFYLLFIICSLSPLPAQSSRNEVPYLLPQTIFVGDPGRLVVPLGQAFAGVVPFILENPAELLTNSPVKLEQAVTQDLVIRRIELERRGGASRLLIDFIPYTPGVLSFPPLVFPSTAVSPDETPLFIKGLEVQVASILSPSQMTLSQPAPPIAVPGTSLLVYGSLVLVLVLLALGIGGSFWGRRHFRDLWQQLRRRHHLRVMMKFLRRLGQEGISGKNGNPHFYLTLLSGEFREFLSVYTGFNCRSLTAGEFLDLPLFSSIPSYNTAFLCMLFRTWDTLRFSGGNVDKEDLVKALEETEMFIIALDKAERSQVAKNIEQKTEQKTGEAGHEFGF